MSSPEVDTPPIETEIAPPQSLITVTTAVYVLQAIGILLVPAFIAGVIVNYVKRDDARGTFLQSHFRWQIRTFWFGLLWAVVAGLTMVIVIGFVVMAVDVIWIMYRIIKGWLDLVDRKPMYRGRSG
jgi:uncharacterized membrane protein